MDSAEEPPAGADKAENHSGEKTKSYTHQEITNKEKDMKEEYKKAKLKLTTFPPIKYWGAKRAGNPHKKKKKRREGGIYITRADNPHLNFHFKDVRKIILIKHPEARQSKFRGKGRKDSR